MIEDDGYFVVFVSFVECFLCRFRCEFIVEYDDWFFFLGFDKEGYVFVYVVVGIVVVLDVCFNEVKECEV